MIRPTIKPTGLDVGVPLEASEVTVPMTEPFDSERPGYVGGAPGTEAYADRTGDAGGAPGADTYADRTGDTEYPPDNAFGQPTDPRNPDR